LLFEQHAGLIEVGPTGGTMSMSRQHRPTRLAFAAAIAIVLVMVTACADSEPTDATKSGQTNSTESAISTEELLGPINQASGDPVKVGVVSDGVTPSVDTTNELAVAKATVAYLNERKGGIGGRPIELTTCETKGDPAGATDCANQMIQDEVVGVLVGQSAVLESIWQPLATADIPAVFASAATDAVLDDPTSTFIFDDPIAGTHDVTIDAAKKAGVDKVTVILVDVPAALDAFDGAEAIYGAAGLGLNIVKVPIGTPDVTAQLQPALADDPGIVYMLGPDSFCIAALQGMSALGFDGPVAGISPCFTDATREAIPGDQLEGIVMPSAFPGGVDDETTALYRAVMQTYGDDIDLSESTGNAEFSVVAGFAQALEGITGDITPATVLTTMKSMPDQELPGGAGLRIRCNGKAVPESPAVCVRGTLVATLDSTGFPGSFEPTTTEPIGD
jgi:branched-chain amino acid transport system substrate-binding protein